MAPLRANTPSRHRSSQAVKPEPEPEADTEAEVSASRAKTPYQRRHNQVADTEPEAEIENTETRASRALTSRHHRRRPSRPTEADVDAEEAENQIENPAQAPIPTKNPPAPRQWALYFANLDSKTSNNNLLGFPAHCFLASVLGFGSSIALEVSACMLVGAMEWGTGWEGRC